MADLYIARQQAVGGFEKRLVIKALQARYARHPRLVRLFLDEARLVAKLNHPSIVHVYDVGDAKGKKFIAMEYIQGGTLSDLIRRGVEIGKFLPIEHALHIVGQVAAGLDYAHRHRDPRGEALQIVHGNVSLSNIMVSNEGQAKLIAFGDALAQAEIPREAPIHPARARYMSPEQVAGEAIDHRSDIYSLGIVLYETTVAQPLWRGPTEEILKSITSQPIPPPTSVRPDYSRALERIVMKALEKRPADRYQSADQLRGDLEDFVTAAGIRSDAHRIALYLRDLFPTMAPVREDGIAPARPGDSKATWPALADGADSTATAFELVSRPRGPSAVRRAMIVAIPALTALTAFAFHGRPPARTDAPAAPVSQGAANLRVHGQSVAPPETAFASHSSASPGPAKPAMVMMETPPPRRTTTVSVAGRTQGQRQPQQGIAESVTATAAPQVEAPLASPDLAPPAPAHVRARVEPAPVARAHPHAAAPAVLLPSERIPDPPVAASPPPGFIDSKAVASVVRAHAMEVRACFDRALMEQPDLRGRLSVRATIGADGRVLDVSQLGPAIAGGGRLQGCVLAAFRSWTFPPPQPGARGSISYAFRFE
jgi:tRNA A-37 threonylcarbamoyl transferase component Bud32